MKCRSFIIKTIFLILQVYSIYGYQENSAIIETESYQSLADQFYSYETDSAAAAIPAKKYLIIAKKNKDTLRIADGYYFLSSISRGKIAHNYSDSIIAIIKNHKSKFYPSYAYLNKGNIYYEAGDYKNAFDYFLKLNEQTKKDNNTYLFYLSKKNIGILRSRIGEHTSALKVLKDCYAYYKQYRESDPMSYLTTLFALSDSYNRNQILDSATLINNLGYRESLVLKNEDFKHYFTLNEGINLYSKEKYIIARDSLEKAINALKINKDKANQGMAHFYLAKVMSSLGKEEEAIAEHKKVDEIFQQVSEIMPESRESYETLIGYYKEKEEKDNQLKYIEKLITVDSVLHTNYRYLISGVVQHYDTPRLLSEKQQIIDSLEVEKKSSLVFIFCLVGITIALLFFLVLNYIKRKKYKRRFDELYHSNIPKSKKDNLTDNKREAIDISEKIVNDILYQLEKFEDNLGFLQHNITTNELAKKMNTNSKYLSKVVNYYKKKSFSVYVNELRIAYCIEKLKTDKKFKNYTVKAIAREIGFNSTDAFSKSFYKVNGIQPSYFIKELEKQLNI